MISVLSLAGSALAASTLGSTALAVLADDVVTPDPDSVTPGIIGFIVTFGIALITLFLVIDMVRRVRRVNYRAQVREELEAELAAGQAASGSPTDDTKPV